MAKNVEYKVLNGIDYPPLKRAEMGDIVNDLPKESIGWLIAGGHIVEASAIPEVSVIEEVVSDIIIALDYDLPLEEVVIDGE